MRSKHKEIHQERQRAPEEPSVLVMGAWCREDPGGNAETERAAERED